MLLILKKISWAVIILAMLTLISCQDNRPDPPNGWIQKVNNQTIGRVTLDIQSFNCAVTEKKHVICTPNLDSLEYSCAAIVTFTDGSPSEKWTKDCPEYGTRDTLIFDDGKFSYFYGNKRNP